MKPDKPPYGSPECNGCGLCCKNELCPLGSILFDREDGPCPALIEESDRYVCGLVSEPARFDPIKTFVNGAAAMRDAALVLIGSGVGCDSQTDDEPDDLEYRRRLRRDRRKSDRQIKDAMARWGVMIR